MRTQRNALMFVGIFSLVVALIHGLWGRWLPGYAALATLDARQLDFVQLLNAAITLFLFMMGVTAIVVARAGTLALNHLRAASLLLMLFWIGRFALELAMPLGIPLLFIEDTTVIAKVIMLLPVLVLATVLLSASGKAAR